MVASEPVGADGELPPHLPMERERRNVELRKYGFTQRLHGCNCAGRDDLGSHELAVWSTSRLVSVARSGLLDDRLVPKLRVCTCKHAFWSVPQLLVKAATGEDAGAGGAAGGAVPLARGAGNTARGIRSSRSSSSGVMLEASPKKRQPDPRSG